jgi:hypothetical protein
MGGCKLSRNLQLGNLSAWWARCGYMSVGQAVESDSWAVMHSTLPAIQLLASVAASYQLMTDLL